MKKLITMVLVLLSSMTMRAQYVLLNGQTSLGLDTSANVYIYTNLWFTDQANIGTMANKNVFLRANGHYNIGLLNGGEVIIGSSGNITGDGLQVPNYSCYFGNTVKLMGEVHYTTVTISGNYTPQTYEHNIIVNAACTITLPVTAASEAFVIQNTGAYSITINAPSGKTINGVSSISTTDYLTELVSDGANYEY